MPIVLDAVAIVGARYGQSFLDLFGECMTGLRPKSHFLRQPRLALHICLELAKQVVVQKVLRRHSIPQGWAPFPGDAGGRTLRWPVGLPLAPEGEGDSAHKKDD